MKPLLSALAVLSLLVLHMGGAVKTPGPLGPSLGVVRDSTLELSDVVWQPETSGFFVGSPSIVVVGNSSSSKTILVSADLFSHGPPPKCCKLSGCAGVINSGHTAGPPPWERDWPRNASLFASTGENPNPNPAIP